VSKAKQKGTAAETALVRFLQGQGFPGAERRALGGGGAGEDLGDITGIPALCMEVKNHATYKIPAWLKETEIERINAKADFGILVVKPNKVGMTPDKVGQWWGIMPMQMMMDLLREAGYGDPK
jgi:Holliday junction resolvase